MDSYQHYADFNDDRLKWSNFVHLLLTCVAALTSLSQHCASVWLCFEGESPSADRLFQVKMNIIPNTNCSTHTSLFRPFHHICVGSRPPIDQGFSFVRSPVISYTHLQRYPLSVLRTVICRSTCFRNRVLLVIYTYNLITKWPTGHLQCYNKKGKGFPYSLTSVGPGSDPSVQAVSPQVTISHPPGGRLLLLSARPAATFPAAEHHRSLTGTKLY